MSFSLDSSICWFNVWISRSNERSLFVPLFIYSLSTLSAQASVVSPNDVLKPFSILAAPASTSDQKPLSGPFLPRSSFLSLSSLIFF